MKKSNRIQRNIDTQGISAAKNVVGAPAARDAKGAHVPNLWLDSQAKEERALVEEWHKDANKTTWSYPHNSSFDYCNTTLPGGYPLLERCWNGAPQAAHASLAHRMAPRPKAPSSFRAMLEFEENGENGEPNEDDVFDAITLARSHKANSVAQATMSRGRRQQAHEDDQSSSYGSGSSSKGLLTSFISLDVALQAKKQQQAERCTAAPQVAAAPAAEVQPVATPSPVTPPLPAVMEESEEEEVVVAMVTEAAGGAAEASKPAVPIVGDEVEAPAGCCALYDVVALMEANWFFGF